MLITAKKYIGKAHDLLPLAFFNNNNIIYELYYNSKPATRHWYNPQTLQGDETQVTESFICVLLYVFYHMSVVSLLYKEKLSK